jgi:hypothetical protein
MVDVCPKLYRASALRGVAALTDALDMIGGQFRDGAPCTDKDMAKCVCDAELDVRALLKYALAKLSQE